MYEKHPSARVNASARIGEKTIVQVGAIIEKDCVIGDNCRIGSYAILRPGTVIGDDSVFGNLSICEGNSFIGSSVTIFSQCHITEYMTIDDYVFIAPHFTPTNTASISHGRPGIPLMKAGPHVKFGARIGGGVVLLPGVKIGREAFIGAGSVVTKNVPDFTIAYGVPARVVGEVAEEEHYPDNLYQLFLNEQQKYKKYCKWSVK